MAHKSEILDRGIFFLAGSKLVKIVPYVVLLWWFWFQTGDRVKNRLFVIESVLAALAAMAMSRLIQNLGLERPRPRYDDSLNFVRPFGGSDDALHNWSSFPSDHTALVFALAMPLFVHHRRLGIAALLWSTVLVGLPRVYIGYHYPSDIIAGAVIGAGCGYLIHKFDVAARVGRHIGAVVESYPAWFYAGAFLFTQQLADMFDGIRHIGRVLAKALDYLS